MPAANRASLDELRRGSHEPQPLDDPAIQIGKLVFGKP